MTKREWIILSDLKKIPVQKEDIIKILLDNRGLKNQKEIKEFLNPLDPYLLTAKDLDINSQEVKKAITRIREAISKKEKIIIWGDYDTDGVCATAILWEVLSQAGADVLPFIPKRDEGYGLREEKIEQFKNEGISLIITVDQGIVAYDQAKYAQEQGLDLIITDHHLPGKKKLQVKALVHTIKLAGSGVAWFLAKQFGRPGLELVTIGTVSDVMPLTGLNRAIAKYGLKALQETKNPGLLALYQTAGLEKEKIGPYEIGFIIAPRLNAAGRMEDPMNALRLVLTRNEKRAQTLAALLDRHNRQRQLLTEEMTKHARQLWLTEGDKSKLIFAAHTSYEEGIVGLVAGRLMEEFYRPAIVVAQGKDYSRASARSINGFNIVEALRSCQDILGSHGGHAMAAGFTIETTKIAELRARLEKLAEKGIDEEKLSPVVKVDLELDCSFWNLDFWEELAALAPFGFGNPEPVFLSRNIEVVDARLVGANSQHLKLRVTCHKLQITFDAIGFNFGPFLASLGPGKTIDLVYNLQKNEWNGNKSIQLRIKDLKLNDGS